MSKANDIFSGLGKENRFVEQKSNDEKSTEESNTKIKEDNNSNDVTPTENVAETVPTSQSKTVAGWLFLLVLFVTRLII